MIPDNLQKPVYFSEDYFNSLLPEHLQKIAKTHFTPVQIGRNASEWLTERGRMNILDIGAGVGKFCITGALHTDSFYTGIEYRESLVTIANELIEKFAVKNAIVKSGNVMDVDFSEFDGFYMFNPFYENIVFQKRLNNEVQLSDALHRNYLNYTREQLDKCKPGCRLVTFHGENREVPDSFEQVRSTKHDILKLWVKV